MTADRVPVLMPCAERSGEPERLLAPRVNGFRAKTIGIINNGWRCLQTISDEYKAVLVGLGVAEIVERKIPVLERLPAPLMDEMVQRCDAVIVGLGN